MDRNQPIIWKRLQKSRVQKVMKENQIPGVAVGLGQGRSAFLWKGLWLLGCGKPQCTFLQKKD
ncbi:hypothetical protein EDM56_19970 [Brevibacillus fluminis]|uniref:Uncharacterized protein n=1 Tax=Brevibacillus fluminis TaxID=511487 RepID=A0A3M8D9X5_9BACL|nr:hypothetical protein EDM56_19970 [Brevibacillus fluminis]